MRRYRRFVDSESEVELPSDAAWLVRGPCILPRYVPPPHEPGAAVSLATIPFVAFPGSDSWAPLKEAYFSATMPTDPGFMPNYWSQIEFGIAWQEWLNHDYSQSHFFDSLLDLHAGGYVTPPLNFAFSNSWGWMAPMGVTWVAEK